MTPKRQPADRAAHDLGSRRRRPPLREAHKEFTRSLLLDAAVETFAREGYLKATVNDIVTAASTTRATFYQHFSGKREIVKILLEDLAERARGLGWTPYGPGDFPVTRELLRTWLVTKVEFAQANRVVFEAVEDACAEDVEFRALWQSVVNTYVDDLAPQLERAGSRYPPHVYALLLILQTERFFSFWIVRGGQPVDADAALETLTDLWADAFGIGSFDVPDQASDDLPRRRVP
jgi:AcrR family transcriptional regulator